MVDMQTTDFGADHMCTRNQFGCIDPGFSDDKSLPEGAGLPAGGPDSMGTPV
jgi:hypothetical protein